MSKGKDLDSYENINLGRGEISSVFAIQYFGFCFKRRSLIAFHFERMSHKVIVFEM